MPTVLTFAPHPRQFFAERNRRPELSPPQINGLRDKLSALSQAGIEQVVLARFNQKFADMSAESYIKDFLFNTFHPAKIVIGYDHRFGKGRTGDFRLMEKSARELGFEVIEISAQILNQVTISSTKIRTALSEGQVKTANSLLGYQFTLSGTVAEGNKLGRTIGFPTANIELDSTEKLIPLNGVYAVQVMVNQSNYTGMINIGLRPTVDGKKRTIEVNIFDFDADIYHQKITVKLMDYIRPEVKFEGIEALKEQLNKDRIDVKERFIHYYKC